MPPARKPAARVKKAMAPAKAATTAKMAPTPAKAVAKKAAAPVKGAPAVKKAAPTKKVVAAKAASPVTMTLKHFAAELAEGHDLPKKLVETMLGDLVTLATKHLQKGDKIRLTGLGILQVRSREA